MKRFLLKIVSAKYVNRWVILGSDIFVSTFCTLLSCIFVSYVLGIPMSGSSEVKILIMSAISGFVSFLGWKTYRNIIRHMTLKELWRIGAAVFTKIIIISAFCCIWETQLPYKFLLLAFTLDFLFTSIAIIAYRILLILMYGVVVSNLFPKQKSVFMYGTDSDAVSFAMALPDKDYRIGGFITRGGGYQAYRIIGKPVYKIKDIEELAHLFGQVRVDAVIFPNEKSVRLEKDVIVRFCEKEKIKILVGQPVEEIPRGRNTGMRKVREIRIEDLLGRDEIEINMNEIISNFENKIVMVTGAAGSIGSELCRQLATFRIKRLILFDMGETPMHELRLELEERFPDLDFVPVIGDVRQEARVDFAFRNFHPQIVFHAAAYKHVPLMEENPCEAVLVNVRGTCNLANYSVKYGVEKFVMVSTDKAVNPSNIMGASKRLAEIYVQSLSVAIGKGLKEGETRFITTRFGNVLGSNGSVIPRFRAQIEAGGPVTVTHPDIIRYFMTIPEACRLVMEAATMGKGDEIFIFEMGEPVKIADLAYRMIELAGFVPNKDIMIEFTGLRPGEKLYEELLSNKENTIPTTHRKIRIANVRQYDFNEVAEAINKLTSLSIDVKIPETVMMMKEIVPEFKSKNSVYEKYDQQEAGVLDAFQVAAASEQI
ncbi:polysaccharide biosynthesis protein [Coprobacter tertius]|uniref:Polysaccharide biosynthesis protein n=1 Tax=Coprobacter tertius TaxID=2944915 RepID=A0ABT1MHE1_9BACT|nr:nucleoside-diphosphate sugar epimerase/dehydratase [Coprobacter tertius]MCP9611469.1 polysaccharide biosynthesis protein [Coprobacter tertius]